MHARTHHALQAVLDEYGGPPSLPRAAVEAEEPAQVALHLGLSALGAGRHDDAHDHLRRALSLPLEPGDRERALVSLADVALARRQPGDAVDALRQALVIRETPLLLLRLAAVLPPREAAPLRRRAAERCRELQAPLRAEADRLLALFKPLRRGAPVHALSLQTPAQILERSWAEVGDDPLSERVFGPRRDLRCACGKLDGMEHFGKICPGCGVEVLFADIRALRCGHIPLACFVLHPHWYRGRGRQSRCALLLDLPQRDLQYLLNGERHAAVHSRLLRLADGDPRDKIDRLLLPEESDDYCDNASYDRWRGNEEIVAMAGPSFLAQLLRPTRPYVLDSLRAEVAQASNQEKLQHATRRLAAFEELMGTEGGAEGLALEVLPVLPPAFALPGAGKKPRLGADLAPAYRLVIEANEALKNALEISAPWLILRDLERRLQEAVDGLFDQVHEAA